MCCRFLYRRFEKVEHIISEKQLEQLEDHRRQFIDAALKATKLVSCDFTIKIVANERSFNGSQFKNGESTFNCLYLAK